MGEAPVWKGLGYGGRGKNVGEARQGICGMRRAGEITELASKEEVVMVGLGGLNCNLQNFVAFHGRQRER